MKQRSIAEKKKINLDRFDKISEILSKERNNDARDTKLFLRLKRVRFGYSYPELLSFIFDVMKANSSRGFSNFLSFVPHN